MRSLPFFLRTDQTSPPLINPAVEADAGISALRQFVLELMAKEFLNEGKDFLQHLKYHVLTMDADPNDIQKQVAEFDTWFADSLEQSPLYFKRNFDSTIQSLLETLSTDKARANFLVKVAKKLAQLKDERKMYATAAYQLFKKAIQIPSAEEPTFREALKALVELTAIVP
jgi:hypothetical protein